MSVFGDVGVAAAARIERSLGPSMGLRAYRRLFTHAESNVRAEAALAAVRCARATHDDEAVQEAAACWAGLTRIHPGMGRVVVSLVKEGRDGWATVLAAAHAKLRRDARGHYLLARVHLAFDRIDDALLCFDRAARHGEPAFRAVAVAMRLRLAGDTGAQAVALAREVDAGAATRAQQACIAKALLGAPSAFSRARGLSMLARLAEVPDDVGKWAIGCAARHADAAGSQLTWVEADRIAVAIGKHIDEEARDRAEVALVSLRRLCTEEAGDIHRAMLRSWPDGDRYLELVEALQQGLEVQPEALELEVRHPLHGATRALSVIAALERSEPDVAAAHLRALDQLDFGARLPAPLWTAWIRAAAHREPNLRAVAMAQLRAALARPSSPPPRGYLSLEALLRRWGDPDELLDVLRRATARGEPGARDALVRELAARGWQAHGDGHRHRAAAWLREAKLLA